MSIFRLPANVWLRRIRPYSGAVFMIVLVGLLFLVVPSLVKGLWTARTETRVATGQRDAATASGHDAVQAVGGAATRQDDIHLKVEVGTDAIRQAPHGDSNDAALRAACGMRSYRSSKQCVQLLGPVAE